MRNIEVPNKERATILVNMIDAIEFQASKKGWTKEMMSVYLTLCGELRPIIVEWEQIENDEDLILIN